jgi:hypothetical protein
MKSPIELIEQIIRAKMALQLTLSAASRTGGQDEIGGRGIDVMIAEVDAGRLRYEQMLVCFKNEIAPPMMAAAGMGAEDAGGPPSEARESRQEP